MEHLAIMKKSWGLTEKILSGKKIIESRWYMAKYAPWDRVKQGDTIYFKNSGEPVTAKAKVDKVLQFSGLTEEKVQEILSKYGKEDGIESNEIEDFYQLFKNKKYCILMFLKCVEKVEPFEIDKRGFGMQSAWIGVESIESIKI